MDNTLALQLILAALDEHDIIKYFIPSIAAMAGVVTILWKIVNGHHIRTLKKLEETEIEHKETQARLLSLTEKIGLLEGRQEGVEQFAERVIEEVNKLPCKAFHPGCPEGYLHTKKSE